MANYNIIELLLIARNKWTAKDYSSHPQRNFMDSRRDNEVSSIDNLIAEIKDKVIISENKAAFARKLIENARKI